MITNTPFVIDDTASDHEYLYVGIATVAIKLETEGIVVDIWPLHRADGLVATTAVTFVELLQTDACCPPADAVAAKKGRP